MSYPRANARWSPAEDRWLLKLYGEAAKLGEKDAYFPNGTGYVARALGRTHAAVSLRLYILSITIHHWKLFGCEPVHIEEG
jgi:hypothetical protein